MDPVCSIGFHSLIQFMIQGLIIKTIKTHSDERGFFREIIRPDSANDGFVVGQMSHSLVNSGVTKAWHGHKEQTQLTYLASGSAVFVFLDLRDNHGSKYEVVEKLSSPYLEPWYAITPPGVYIGYFCSQGPANIFYVTSGKYDTKDELRFAYDDFSIDYKWEKWKDIR